MISIKDIERWYTSAHFRKKCDWICLDQPKVIKEWSKRNCIGQVIFSDAITPPEWSKKLPCLTVRHQWLTKITGKPSHMGLMVIMERPTYKVSDLMRANRVLLLDGIQDPGNLGTMVRSMVAFGCTTLCLTNDCVDPFNPKCVSASTGSIAMLTGIFYETHWDEWIKKTTHSVVVLDPYAAHSMWDIEKTTAFVLVCGSEGRGIQSKLIKSVPLTPVSIPMADGVDSLNAGICVSIALNYLDYQSK
jgi:TrmH family RNA methyltransferase